MATLDGDGMDAFIRFRAGPCPPLRAEPLFDLALFPLSSPDFIARDNLDGPSKLASAPLIEQRDSP